MSDRVNTTTLRAEFRPSYRPEKKAAALPDLHGIGVLAACFAGVVACGVGVVTLFGHRHHGVPVIEAPAGPVRIKPIDAGGMKLNGNDLATAPPGTQALAPPAEQPEIDALRAQLQAVKKQLARQAAQNAETAKLAASKIIVSPAPAQASATLRVPVDAAPPPEPGVRVQLAAFTDSAAAYAEWNALAEKWPDLLARRRPEISRIDAAGRTIWRLRTGPFPTVSAADNFCTTLRSHGADCSIAAF